MMTTLTAIDDCTTQIGVVCSTASGPAGLRLARLLGLQGEGCQRAELRIEAVDPSNPCTPTVWTRTFGQRSWSTTVAVSEACEVVERIGPLTVSFGVDLGGETLVLRSNAMSLGPLRWSGRLPATVSVSVSACGDATISIIEVAMGKLGHLRYVATMREVGQP